MKERAQKECCVCGVTFRGRGTSAYCSDDCKNRYRGQKGAVRSCQNCNKTFKQRGHNWGYMFCNELCQKEFLHNRKNKRLGKIYFCQNCRKEYKKKDTAANEYGNRFCSRNCSFEYRANNKKEKVKSCKVYFNKCVNCEKVFTAKYSYLMRCSDKCIKEYASSYHLDRSLKKHFGKICKCKTCGNDFNPEYGTKQRAFCSKKCKEKELKQARKIGKDMRSQRIKDVFVDKITLPVLHKRDNGVCGICHKKVDARRKAPHPLSPSIDHILPLAQGGWHEWSNVQLAHFSCNSRKGKKVQKIRQPTLIEAARKCQLK